LLNKDQQCGRWTVLGAAHPLIYKGKKRRQYYCRCQCGTERIVLGTNLQQGLSKSCGCYQKENPGHFKHGHTKKNYATSTYYIWAEMIQRCFTPTHKRFNDYGGRGITVCNRWRDFQNFLSDMGEKPESKSLDRMDNNGNYEPGNCRWATKDEQINNTRQNVYIDIGEIRITMKQFSRAYGIPYARFRYLYRTRKMSIDQILLREKCLD